VSKFRNTLQFLSLGLLTVALFCLVISSGLYLTLLSPQNTKQIIRDSGAYTSMSKVAVDTIVSQKNSVDVVPLDNPAVVTILKKTFTPDRVQIIGESLIDNTYRWLNGEIKVLPLAFDITASKQQFISSIGDYVQQRYQRLPQCITKEQSVLNQDLFVSVCRPPGIDTTQLRNQIEQRLSDNPYIPSALGVFGAIDGKINQTQSIIATSNEIPRWYRFAKQLPILLVIVSSVLLVVSFLLNPSKKERINKVFLLSGALLAVLGTVFFVFPSIGITVLSLNISQASETIILPMLLELSRSLGKILIYSGLGLILTHIVLKIIINKTSTKKVKHK